MKAPLKLLQRWKTKPPHSGAAYRLKSGKVIWRTLGEKRGATMSELAIDICIVGFALCVVGYAELHRIFRERQAGKDQQEFMPAEEWLTEYNQEEWE